jgi:hypothetical protein
MSTVYIPHIVRRASNGSLTPKFDFTEAAQFGTLKEIVGEFEDLLFTDRITSIVQDALADFQPDDYLLAVGDPTAIALCAGVIFRKHSSVKMLKWDRQTRKYLMLELKL